MENVISINPMAAALPSAFVAPDKSAEAADAAQKIAHAREEILDEYRQKHRYPWVVAYSGGKDSTLVLQLVFEMLLGLPPEERRREIHVVGNDTLVESPPVIEHLHSSIKQIREAARKFNLPLSAAVTKPDIDQTFWVNVIGRGYAPPSRMFRWCTDRMKIQPTNGYILRRVHERGSVILLIGARRAESNNRRRTMDKYHRRGRRLSKHPSLAKCRIFSPISELETDEVWMTLLQRASPWSGTHRKLVTLYRNARGGECPTVLSKEDVPSCGTTSPRFGCWTCTVVPKDRSMAGLIDSGFDLFEPLMEFRDWLQEIRAKPEEYRMKTRRDGTVRYKDGNVIYGPFTMETRREILKRLRKVEQEADRSLILPEEEDLIRDIWREDAVLEKIRARRYLQEEAYA